MIDLESLRVGDKVRGTLNRSLVYEVIYVDPKCEFAAVLISGADNRMYALIIHKKITQYYEFEPPAPAADPYGIGKQVKYNGYAYTIVAITPSGRLVISDNSRKDTELFVTKDVVKTCTKKTKKYIRVYKKEGHDTFCANVLFTDLAEAQDNSDSYLPFVVGEVTYEM